MSATGVRQYLKTGAVANNMARSPFSAAGFKAIHHHPWSGSTRELGNRIKRAVIMAEGRRITSPDFAYVG